MTDVIMPKKNGAVMYQDICRIKADLPVIFMSGYTADIMGDNDYLAGNKALLYKPIKHVTLLAKVREMLDGKKGITAAG